MRNKATVEQFKCAHKEHVVVRILVYIKALLMHATNINETFLHRVKKKKKINVGQGADDL